MQIIFDDIVPSNQFIVKITDIDESKIHVLDSIEGIIKITFPELIINKINKFKIAPFFRGQIRGVWEQSGLSISGDIQHLLYIERLIKSRVRALI